MSLPNRLAAAAPDDVQRAMRATYAAFIGNGFVFASWASRIPQVKQRLGLSPADLGLVLLAIAGGSVVSLPISGVIVRRVSSRTTIAVASVVMTSGLGIVALGYLSGVMPVVVGLFLLGFANGAWDVAMNVQGAEVERQLGRSILSRFHAGFSLGTVAGALVGVLMVALSVPVTAHLLVVAVVVGVVVPLLVRAFLPDGHTPDGHSPAGHSPAGDERAGHSPAGDERVGGGPAAEVPAVRASGALGAWLEPRTLLLGVFVLAFAFAEGTGNDWISLAMIEGHHVSPALGTVAYAAFLTAMTAGRWFGPSVLDRHGRVAVMRALAVISFAGVLLFVWCPVVPIAVAGVLLWGLGTSLGFPVGMSAAADDPAAAAGRVSVVASIGYCAFLGGPPVIGLIGSSVGVLHALTASAVLLIGAMVLSSELAPR